MSAHETTHASEQIDPGSDRSFGLIVGGILFLIAVYQYFTDVSWFLYLGLPGAALMLAALAIPKILHPLNIAWTRLGILLGSIVTPIVMLLVYVVTIIPIGLLIRISGKDLLRLKREEEAVSYWIDRDPPGPSAESLKDQF